MGQSWEEEADLLGPSPALITRWLFLALGRAGQVARAPVVVVVGAVLPAELTLSVLLLVPLQCKGH